MSTILGILIIKVEGGNWKEWHFWQTFTKNWKSHTKLKIPLILNFFLSLLLVLFSLMGCLITSFLPSTGRSLDCLAPRALSNASNFYSMLKIMVHLHWLYYFPPVHWNVAPIFSLEMSIKFTLLWFNCCCNAFLLF